MRSLFFSGLFLSLALGCGNPNVPDPAGQVPDALLEVESLAEDAFDLAIVLDFSGVETTATDLDTSWQAFRAQALSDGAAQTDVDAIDAAIITLLDLAATSTDVVVVARATNAISAPMDKLFAVYNPVIPTEILQLDFLGREIVVDGLAVDFTLGSTDIDTLEAVWLSIRDQIIAAGGDVQAAICDDSIIELRAAITAADSQLLIGEANDNLEIVDLLEGLFE
jgi:hypothetical protein